ncbi:hypothetical protein I4U23_000171 [Adineta vaga]|nr:hypothetical protein I4U23_000171 [Adineta vaga]
MTLLLGAERPDLLQDEYLHDIFLISARRCPNKIALRWLDEEITYGQLHQRALNIAHALRDSRKVGSGCIVGLWLTRSALLHTSILAVLMTGATYVPFDADTPEERVNEVLADLKADLLLVDSQARCNHPVAVNIQTLPQNESTVDIDLKGEIDNQSIAYIICTSGSTGKPKAIAITHKNICHFVRADNEILHIKHDDIIYQGSSAAFDLFLEETFLTYLVGATMVIGSKSDVLNTDRLHLFLIHHSVTVIFSVPTLLLLLHNDPALKLRLLNVGGEALPKTLIDRWWKEDRLIYNSYGPTETTVAATLSLVHPDQSISIGVPLPNYVCCLLDEISGQPTSANTGELCIRGPGVARGYVGSDELTKEKFTEYGYRTGDQVTFENGQIYYHQRIDTQVKVRGFRIELSEIEEELLNLKGNVLSAAVTVQNEQIIAYVVGELSESKMRERLAKRIPRYMVPDRLIKVDEKMPLLSSGKIDRKALHVLSVRDHSEKRINGTITDSKKQVFLNNAINPSTMGIVHYAFQSTFPHAEVTENDDFFRDLGGHSLTAAQTISKLRESFPNLSIQDLYECKTAKTLAERLSIEHNNPKANKIFISATAFYKPSILRLTLCSLIQAFVLLIIFGISALDLLLPFIMFDIALHEYGLIYAFFAAYATYIIMPVLLNLLATLVKWIVIGRYREGDFLLWSSMYVRWWTVNQFLALSSFDNFSDTPWMSICYRLLGAKIGRNVHIGDIDCSAADLLSVGDGSTLSSDVDIRTAFIADYTLKFRRVCIGYDVHVGTQCVLNGGSSMKDHSKLCSMSFLPSGMCIPSNEAWQGSPAKYCYQTIPEEIIMESNQEKLKSIFVSFIFLLLISFFLPLMNFLPMLPGLLLFDYVRLSSMSPWLQVLCFSPVVGILYTCLIIIEIIVIRFIFIGSIKEGVYSTNSLTFIRKWTFDQLFDVALENIYTVFATIYARPLLRAFGMKIGQRCEVSYASGMIHSLVEIGDESFVADTVTLANPYIFRGQIHIQKTIIGQRVFIGNAACIDSGIQIPNQCLIGCMSTVADQLKEGESCVGSPPIILTNRYNTGADISDQMTYRPSIYLILGRTIIETLRIAVPRIVFVFEIGIAVELFIWSKEYNYMDLYLLALPLNYIVIFAIPSLLLCLALKWLLIGKYRIRQDPLWSPFVWISEFVTVIYENLVCNVILDFLHGTVFLAPILRCFGVHIGRGCYLDTADITEFDLVHIGDYVVMDTDVGIQTHLFEDRVMKLGDIFIENEVMISGGSIILLNTRIGHGANIGPFSLVMQGECIPPETHWQGVPIKASTTEF